MGEIESKDILQKKPTTRKKKEAVVTQDKKESRIVEVGYKGLKVILGEHILNKNLTNKVKIMHYTSAYSGNDIELEVEWKKGKKVQLEFIFNSEKYDDYCGFQLIDDTRKEAVFIETGDLNSQVKTLTGILGTSFLE